ncbi:MAG: hypothetical protein KC684_04665 [Candidatus Omnitrophica bacterium]|nr:hypothetical protein [Candidatus Omnitrophota bacterium]
MKKIYLIVAVSVLGLFCTNVEAQILVEQGKVIEVIAPGETVTGVLNIHNTSGEPINVIGYWEDFDYVEPYNGNKKFLPAGAGEKSASEWINLSPTSFQLAPFQRKEVSYVINPPQDSTGGYYGVVFFEKESPDVDSRLGVRIVSRVGSLFFLESVDQKRSGRYENIVTEGSGFTGKFTNEGNVILIAEGVYFILDAEGLAVDRGEVPNIYLPPGKTADYKIPFSNELTAGSYTLLLTVDLGEGASLVKEIDFQKTSSGDMTIKEVRD